VYVTTGYRLVSLNAHTGALVTTFAERAFSTESRRVRGVGEQIDLESGEIGVTRHRPSPATW
jgi:hypothetical protein